MIGTGYVGLVTGACRAENGNDVWCVEVDKEKIDRLLEGHIPIYEPGLEDIVRRNVAQGRLHSTTEFLKNSSPLHNEGKPHAYGDNPIVLATRISFMNELDQFCEVIDGDIGQIRKGMRKDS